MPVVLLPGGVLPARPAYEALLAELGPQVDARAKDLEMYAAGTVPPSGYGLDTEVEGVRRSADAAGFDTFHLVGYSAGGASAIAFASRYPQRLRSLALMELAWAGRAGQTPREAAVFACFRAITGMAPEEILPAFIRNQLAAGVPAPLPQPGPAPPWMASRLVAIPAFLAAFDAFEPDLLRRLDRPVYYALGGRSEPDLYARIATRLADVFADVTLETYVERHHFDPPHRTEPARTAAALRALWVRAEEGDRAGRAERTDRGRTGARLPHPPSTASSSRGISLLDTSGAGMDDPAHRRGRQRSEEVAMSSVRWFARAILALALTAGVGSPVAGEDDVSGALLIAEDVPDGLASDGPTHDPQFDFDIADFEANGGLDAVDQIWTVPEVTTDTAIAVVFDFRFLFPDEASAAAYLDAAEPVLSESSTGLALRSDGVHVGDDTRHYAGTLAQGDLTIMSENILFRTGPVVAKAYITGFDVPFDAAAAIATAAGERTRAWLDAAAPGTSPAPGASPRASTSPAVSPTAATPARSGEAGLLRQWASSAQATSQYSPDRWSARHATGEPDVVAWADDENAWTTLDSDVGIQSIELTYETVVVPREVNVVETYQGGAVVRIEARDPTTGDWAELWSGRDPSPPDRIATFSPELERVGFPTDSIRVTLDTDLVSGFNEIDAVELVGVAR
jgi:pimeloyl-ACP methyl ester carboxylesterase